MRGGQPPATNREVKERATCTKNKQMVKSNEVSEIEGKLQSEDLLQELMGTAREGQNKRSDSEKRTDKEECGRGKRRIEENAEASHATARGNDQGDAKRAIGATNSQMDLPMAGLSWGPALGGDYAGCVDAEELDRGMSAILHEVADKVTVWPAETFWRAAHAPAYLAEVLARLRAWQTTQKKNRDTLVLPTWVRSHWVLTVCKDREVMIWDSAPSQPVARDLRKIFLQVFDDVKYGTSAKQTYGSNECGLFVL